MVVKQRALMWVWFDIGGPISPFMFLIVMEDLIGLVEKSTELGEFHGFYLNEEVNFDILQFV